MKNKKEITLGTCVICHKGEVKPYSKNEVKCENCGSQYPLATHKKLSRKVK